MVGQAKFSRGCQEPEPANTLFYQRQLHEYGDNKYLQYTLVGQQIAFSSETPVMVIRFVIFLFLKSENA